MRVLLVSDFLPPVRGGLETHVATLAQELNRLGHVVRIATLTVNPDPVAPEVQVQTLRTSVRLLPHDRPDRPFHPPIPEPRTRRSLAHAIRQFAPDVIHAHSWLGVSLPRSRPPLLVTAHDYGLVCELRTLLHPSGELCAGPGATKCIGCARPVLGLPTATLMTAGTVVGRRLLRPDKVLAVSAAVASSLQPHLADSIEIVPNFVGDEPEAAALPGFLPEADFVLFAGDPGPHKGVQDLLEVWAGSTPPSAPLVLALTGPHVLALPPNVYAAMLSPNQMTAAWRRAAVAVVPSRWADPCPTVALEAMRAGTPVVGTAVGGLPEMVRDGIEGFLVPARSPLKLAERLGQLLGDDALRTRMGASARLRSESFTARRVVPTLVEIYAQLIERPESSPVD